MCSCGHANNPCTDSQTPGANDTEPERNPYSGFLIVRLSREVGPGKSAELRRLAEELSLAGLARVLDELGDVRTRRVVTSVEPERLLRMEQQAYGTTRSFRPVNSLTRYWRIDLRDGRRDPDETVAMLRRLPEVELAYRELIVSDPLVNAADDTYAAQQGYLDAAPAGIDARWAWSQTGGDGAGVGFVDLEQGWFAGHEDLPAVTVLVGDNRDGVGTYKGDHGTAVLGEIVGRDNTRGVVGIATNATLRGTASHYDAATDTALHVADAIVGALGTLRAGDVLLLEVQRGAAPLPTESDAADYDAIRLASARGIIVVEAAGNGSNNLDTWLDAAGKQRLNRASADFRDSGAIMVGAASSTSPHNRLGFSNYGSRVDCYGWGQNVVSAGYRDLAGTTDNTSYTSAFNGTSSASPIVAGAAVLTQGMYAAASGGRLSPGQMRSILSNPANGTAQGDTATGQLIGVMPNLRTIGQNVLGLVPDCYLRDAVGDTGTVPSTGALSISPDVVVRLSAVADPQASFGEGSGTENDDTLGETVEAGQDNIVYVRARNRGAADVTDATATVYWSPASTLVTPNNWHLIGTTGAFTVPQGNTLQVSPPLTWAKGAIPGTGHYCFVAVLGATGDPAPLLPGPTDWTGFLDLVRNQNNVTWRNFNVVDVLPDPSADPVVLDFLVLGAPDEARKFDFELVLHMPADARVEWQVPPALVAALPEQVLGWRVKGEDERAVRLDVPVLRSVPLCGVRLGPDDRFPTRLVVHPSKGLAAGLHTIAVRQLYGDLEVGRITWGLRPAQDR